MTVYYDPNTQGFYLDGVHKVPEGAVEISRAKWRELRARAANQEIVIQDGQPVLQTAVVPLAEVKKRLKLSVDEAAAKARCRYITSIAGQLESYSRKAAQAQAYKDAGYPADLTPYPYIKIESEASGQTGRQVADTILLLESQWTVLDPEVEGRRAGGKRQIDEAVNETAAQTAHDTTVAALNSI